MTNRDVALGGIQTLIAAQGRWWEPWQEAASDLAARGYGATAEIAVNELKQIFTAEWLVNHPYHEFSRGARMPLATYGHCCVIPLGLAISTLGGASKLSNTTVSNLRSPDNFIHRMYELEVKAFIRLKYGARAAFEEELGFPKGEKTPDAKVDNAYLEIKDMKVPTEEAYWQNDFTKLASNLNCKIPEKLRESALKCPEGSSITVIMRVPELLFYIATMTQGDLATNMVDNAFRRAALTEPKVKRVKELWFDATISRPCFLTHSYSEPFDWLGRAFIEFGNTAA